MRILVLHAWLKGNLGDVLQLSVLLRALRNLKPGRLDLAGFPARPALETGEVLHLVDRYLPDTFPWYWSMSPALAGRLMFEPWWASRRRSMFAGYDAIVCAPGPYLADYDRRASSALCDLAVARELGKPVVLASHSIGPLQPPALSTVATATLRVAREPSTFKYLSDHGIAAVRSADLAFLYPYQPPAGRAPGRSYRLVFLRSNNLDARQLRCEQGALFDGPRLIAAAAADPIVLATSDYRRDARFLSRAARGLGVPFVACRSVTELVALVTGSSAVVSDRYHPAICAAVLGKPAQVVPNREPHKMRGLECLLGDNSLEALQTLARAGLNAVCDAIRGHA
ncbi:MAG TPA: polysaccharide pyruvyl transferase family protein [Vicinamibacterales bacterium]|nr:polysaccharide pyruvyl transferase family protein [Vicinamibacterales bacterium]